MCKPKSIYLEIIMFVSKHSQVTGSQVTALTLSQYKTLNPKPTDKTPSCTQQTVDY